MRRALPLILASALLVACGEPGAGGTPTTEPTSTTQPASPTPEIMAVALTQLVVEDNTFGEGPPPFTEYFILATTDPGAGDPTTSSGDPARELTEAERAAIEDGISEFGPVTWIDDVEESRTDELMPVVEGSAILGVGEPVVEEDTALVPVSLWCGGLCGTWFSYRVDLVEGSWVVTDIEGPVAIS